MHNLIRVLFLNSFLFPTVNAEHIASTGIYINAVSVWIVFCRYRSHRIKSLKTGEISIGIYGDDRTFKMTWRAIMQDKNHHIIVKKLDGKIVSSCVCVIIPNLTRNIRPYAFIENVVTHSDYRGKGYATECLNYAKQIAENTNCYKMMLLTGSKKKEILNFYGNARYNSTDKTAFIQWIE